MEGQYEIDITLQSDRDLKDNIQAVVKFAYEQFKQDRYPDPVKNRHEGYGIAADKYADLAGTMKHVNDDMKTYLAKLPDEGNDTIETVASLYNSAVTVAVAAIKLASQSQRIMDDLYYGVKTPIEEALEQAAEETEEDEFQEASTEEGSMDDLMDEIIKDK